tara:strand:+ start:1788 stop:2537 length:750 start_codon:yes stop_codon:yes gene_type:complete
MTSNFQEDYSKIQPLMFEVEGRIQKAKKVLSVITDFVGETKDKDLLDIGCSTGIMTNYYSDYFKSIDAIDIDAGGIKHATETNSAENINYVVSPVEDFIEEKKYDVITCSHIYEHVPDSKKLFVKIYELLKPGGVCYLAAGNRYQIYENHYGLYFLSYFPKKVSNLYLKLTNKGDYYYENHLSLFKLRKLVKKFNVHDYTIKIIKNPSKYSASEMFVQNSFSHKIIKFFSTYVYFFIPTYIWILEKPSE